MMMGWIFDSSLYALDYEYDDLNLVCFDSYLNGVSIV